PAIGLQSGRSPCTMHGAHARLFSWTWTFIRESRWRSFGTLMSRSRWRFTRKCRHRPRVMHCGGLARVWIGTPLLYFAAVQDQEGHLGACEMALYLRRDGRI